jgi:hypothetical protein
MYDAAILVRLRKETHQTLKDVAEARGENVSSFTRQIIINELGRLGFLNDREKKALGFSERPQLPGSPSINSRNTK